MAAVSREATTPQSSLAIYVERSLEVLWILTVALVPLMFWSPFEGSGAKDAILSEAVNAYVEVPKTTVLRILVGMMTILWVVEWVLRGGLSGQYSIAHYFSRIKNWVAAQPARWVVVAAILYMATTLISTALSVPLLQHDSLVSIWGEVSGQFGYSAYTTLSYVLLFAIIVTHLKTPAQLWRLLAAIVTTGAIVAFYAIMQHFCLDPFDLGEGQCFDGLHPRVSATMANSVFGGTFLVGTTVMTMGMGRLALELWGWTPLRIAMWVTLITMQLLAIYWTGSRGSWLLGAPAGLLAFAVLPTLADTVFGWARDRTLPRDMLALLALLVLLGFFTLLAPLDLLNIWDLPGLPDFRLSLGFLSLMSGLSLLIVLWPSQFTPGVQSFAKTFLVLASSLLIALIVIALTRTPGDALGLDFKDLSILPDLRILLGVLGFLLALSLVMVRSAARVTSELLLALAKTGLALVSGLVITLVAIGLTLAASSSSVNVDDSATPADPVQEQTVLTTPDVSGRGFSFRDQIWESSRDLIIQRTWFEYEDLSLSFIRPLVGYGPELFKYTFPLESPLGGLLSHAHNFWIHHAVEQGILGFFSSLGLFVAFFGVGLAQVVRNWGIYSTVHKWILVTLLATMIGRVAELMVGVARESDLVLLWALFAIFVVLSSVMSASPPEETPSDVSQDRPPLPRSRQERRSVRPSRRQERRARRSGSGAGFLTSPLQFIALGLVSALVIFMGWLTWDKNVDYFWAGATAASARELFTEGQFQEAQQRMSKAVSKAPDVPIYYHNLAAIYESYRVFKRNNPDSDLPPCHVFFGLEPPAGNTLDARCVEEAYLMNLTGFRKNPTSPQVKLVLANSTLELGLLRYEGKDDEAIRYYDELTKMLPGSWPMYNALATAYIRLAPVQETPESIIAFYRAAFPSLDKSLEVTQGAAESGQALYLRGLAHRRLNEPQEAIGAFEESLARFSNHPNAGEVRRQLVNTYNSIAVTSIQQNRAEEALEPPERSLSITQESSGSGTGFYLQGVAYRQLEELQKAVASFERSLEVDENGPNAANAHRHLADVYTTLGDQAKADEHTRLLAELTQS